MDKMAFSDRCLGTLRCAMLTFLLVGATACAALSPPGAPSLPRASTLQRLNSVTHATLKQAQEQAQSLTQSSTSPTSPLVLTLSQAYQRMLEQDRTLAVLQSEVELARAEVREAFTVDSAELRLGRKSLDSLLYPGQTWQLDLNIAPPHPLQMGAEYAQAQARLEGAQAEVNARAVELLSELRQSLDHLRVSRLELAAAARLLEVQDQLEALSQQRLERSLSTRMEGVLSRLNRAEAQQTVVEHETALARSSADLKERLGLAPAQEVQWNEADLIPISMDKLPILPDESVLLETALKSRPELLAAAAEATAARAAQTGAILSLVPSLSFVQLGYSLAPIPHPTAFSPWTVSAGLEIPIPGFNRQGTRSATAELRSAEKRLKEEAWQRVLAVKKQKRQVDEAATRYEAFQAGPGAAAHQATQEIQAALEAGRVELLQVALIQEKNAALQQKQVEALREYFEALGELRTEVGGTLPGLEPALPLPLVAGRIP